MVQRVAWNAVVARAVAENKKSLLGGTISS
jgi:hypothetical protein